MARMVRLISIAALSLVLTGCVTQEKYNALKLDRDQLAERLGAAETEASAAKAQADLLKKQLDAINAAGGTQSGLLANLTQQNADLQRRLDELNRAYEAALKNQGNAPLPQELQNELRVLADKYPDLIEFDARTGMVKFKSDVTFASGDATLTPRAREVIRQFASILNSPIARNYELLVAGHTDNVRVSNPATIQKGHKDNWYLSAHRAIGVGEALLSDGVSASRLGVAGYADQHPVASNDTAAGRQQNRRVEVLILPHPIAGTPSSGSAAAPASGNGTAAPAAPKSAAVVPNKP